MKLAKFSAKLAANFRRSLEGDFRASFAGKNRQKHIPPKLHRQFHHQTSLRGSGLWRALHTIKTSSEEDRAIPAGPALRPGPALNPSAPDLTWTRSGPDLDPIWTRNPPCQIGPLFLQSGFSDAVFQYMRGFCRDFVVNFAVDFSVYFLSFV